MTETAPKPTAEAPIRAVVAGLIALGGHAVAFLAGYVVAGVVRPSPGGGFEDLAAVVMTFLGLEILIGVGCLVVGAVMFRRGRKYTGVGLLGGWLVGLLILITLIQVQ
jgi:hypothetical protein